MPKGYKREMDLASTLIEMDRTLLNAVRRNMGISERLLQAPIGDSEKSELQKHLARHPMARSKQPEMKPDATPRVLSDRDRLLERTTKTLPGLSDQNLSNLYELAKSMVRTEKPQTGNVRAKPRRIRDAGAKAVSKEEGASKSAASANDAA